MSIHQMRRPVRTCAGASVKRVASASVSSMSHNEFIGDPDVALAAAKRAQKKAAAAPEHQDEMREAREARSAFTDQERAEAKSFMQSVKDENTSRHKKETESTLQSLQERKETARRNASSPTKDRGASAQESRVGAERKRAEDRHNLDDCPEREHVRRGHEAIRAMWELPDAEREQLQREMSSNLWAPALWQAVRESFSGLNCPPPRSEQRPT
jgi:hypothetical protein